MDIRKEIVREMEIKVVNEMEMWRGRLRWGREGRWRWERRW
jgi:hypothetical protein